MSTIIRPEQPIEGHTLVPNEVLLNPALTPKARMIYAFLASGGAGEHMTQRTLSSQIGINRCTLREGLRELVRAGYLEMRPEPRTDESTGFQPWVYTLLVGEGVNA